MDTKTPTVEPGWKNKTMQTQEKKSYSPIMDESSYNRQTEECCNTEESPQISTCRDSATEKAMDGVDYLRFAIRSLEDSIRRGDELAKKSSKRARDLQALLDCLPSKLDQNANNGLAYLLKMYKL